MVLAGVPRFDKTSFAISIGGWDWQAFFGSVPNISIIWLVKVLGQDRPSAVHDKLNLEPNTLNRSNVL